MNKYNIFDTGGAVGTGNVCPKCHKLYTYIGDIPQSGWPIGQEPYCVCGTNICEKCGSRTKDKK